MKVLSNCINDEIRTCKKKLWFYDFLGFNYLFYDFPINSRISLIFMNMQIK